MSRFASLLPTERATFLAEAAARRGISEVVVEKDAWVSWALRALFADDDAQRYLLFKGGTSLSKVHGLIERFSEDIDLGVSPAVLGFDEARIRRATSKSGRARLSTELQQACGQFVKARIMPHLCRSAEADFGPPERGAWFSKYAGDEAGTTLLFAYPTSTSTDFHYIEKVVRLEFGALTDQRPLAPMPIGTILCEALGERFADLECDAITLDASRTFWEKATILHDCALQPEHKPLRARYARHYSDVAVMWAKGGTHLIRDPDLLRAVSRHKELFFSSSWSDYAAAREGRLRLTPPAHRIHELRSDYESMRPMFLDEPLTFEAMLDKITEAEAAISRS